MYYCDECDKHILTGQVLRRNVKIFENIIFSYDALCPFCQKQLGKMMWGKHIPESRAEDTAPFTGKARSSRDRRANERRAIERRIADRRQTEGASSILERIRNQEPERRRGVRRKGDRRKGDRRKGDRRDLSMGAL